MLQRPLAILLSVTFMIVSLNLRLDLHYCHNELIEISFNHNDEHCSGTETNECMSCENVHITVENNQDQINYVLKFELPHRLFFTIKTNSLPPNHTSEKNNFQTLEASDSSPPPKLYQLYSKYCFYG